MKLDQHLIFWHHGPGCHTDIPKQAESSYGISIAKFAKKSTNDVQPFCLLDTIPQIKPNDVVNHSQVI